MTVSVKEKYSLEGQYIDPLIGSTVKSGETFTFIYNPNLTEEALEQIYNSLYDYQVSEEYMAAFGSAAAPVINISSFYGWVKSLNATDSELKGEFIQTLQALLTPGGWKLPSTDSNLPFENHSYPAASADGGFVSLEGYLGLEKIGDNDDLGLIMPAFYEYKKSFNDLKTYLNGRTTWEEIKNKVGELVSDAVILSRYLGDPDVGGQYPEQAKELANYAKSLEILSDILNFWAEKGVTLATTKQFFASAAYQELKQDYLLAAADARRKVVMIGGEEQLTAALIQNLIVERGRALEKYTTDLNTVQNGSTENVNALIKKYGARDKDDLKILLGGADGKGGLIGQAQESYNDALHHYERLTAPVEYDMLLSLVLTYNPFDGTGQRVTALTKHADGTYSATSSSGKYTSEISLKSCEKHMSLPYFALAMCYEKTAVVRTVIVAHVEEIEDLNTEIIENNKWLKYANEAYQNYYSWAIYNNNGAHADDSSKLWRVISTKAGTDLSYATKVSVKDFLNYLRNECGMGEIDAEKIIHWGDYDDKGEFHHSGGNTFNIDVEEQGFLTLISNWQEALRQRGDWLNAESQKKTLELNRDSQTYNSACGINSQICKVVGGTYDTVASNIR